MMSSVRNFFALCLLLVTAAPVLFSQTAGDYRTAQSGTWTAASTWERYDGSAWVTPAPAPPSSADGIITILGGDTVAVDAAVAADQLSVEALGAVLVNAGITFTVADGADSIDMTVSGLLNGFGTIVATGRVSIENGGEYIYSPPGGGTSMPFCTWRSGSTCRIDSTTGTTPTNLNTQALHHLIWNGTTTGANGGPNFADGAVIGGDVTVLSTKSLQWRVTNLSGGQVKNIRILGNLNIAGATAVVTATGSGADTLARAIITIDGDVNLSAGTWNLCNSSNVYAEWKIGGDVAVTGGTLLASGSSGWAGRRTLDFVSGGTQSFSVTAPGVIGTATAQFKASGNSSVQVNFPWTLMANGIVNLAGGRFVTSSTNLLTIPSNGTLLGGGPTSYIDGPLAVVVASASPTAKTFPVGKGGTYRPVVLTVNHDAITATTYTTELFNTAPPARTLPPELAAVSGVRHYSIQKGTGAGLSPAGATVQLAYDADDEVDSAAILRIAKDDGAGNWVNLGGSGTADTVGSITSNAFTTFSDFVLATADTGTPAVTPTVTTSAVSFISTTFATSGGNVTNDGGAAVTARGVCWNTTGAPTTADSATADGNGSGLFASAVTGLSPGVTYHMRAFATNAAGTGYGDEVVFTTLAAIVPPTVTTSPVTGILVTTAVGGGEVTAWGGADVTGRGVCWNTTGNPTIADPHSVDGAGLGQYVSGLAPLTGSTQYYVRAYAVNSAGTGYGSEVSFTTQAPQPDTMVVVDQGGGGDYLTVQAAFNAVPSNYTGRWTIFVRNGVYYEKLLLASTKRNVALVGESRDSTILTYDDYADRHGVGNPGTSGSYSVAIDASDFSARDITFRNTYSPQPGVVGTQAVALRTQGDRHEYVNCNILGYQDTYYTWGGSGTGRMYHRNCTIEGIVDFIFGRNIVVFDSCTIHVIRHSATITAASTDASSQYGYVFRNCTILADSIGYDGTPITSFYLGRPWQASPRTVFLNSHEPATLNPAGWQAWNVTPGLYGEFNCYGPGSATGGRVAWSSQLPGPTAAGYSLSTIFARTSANSPLILYDWMPSSAMSDPPLLMRMSASAGANGSVIPGGTTNITYGGTLGYTIAPDSGYRVADVVVDGGSVGAVSAYEFAAVTANHSIHATFAVSPIFSAPATWDAGTVVLGWGLGGSFFVTNIGMDTLHVDSLFVLSASGDFTTPSGAGQSLAPGESHLYYVQFTPTLVGPQTGLYVFTSNAPTSPDTVVLTGFGGQALFELFPPAVAFGSVPVGYSATDSVTIVNNGTGATSVWSVTSTDARFVPSSTTAGIGPGDSVKLGITFTPDAEGLFAGNMIFAHDGVSSPDTLAVSGIGGAALAFTTLPPDSILLENPLRPFSPMKPVKRFKGLYPNWANLMSEVVTQGGFQPTSSESDSAGGARIGISFMYLKDPVKQKWAVNKTFVEQYHWMRLTKWDFKKTIGKSFNALQKTLIDKTGRHTGAPRGLDYTTDGKNKPLKGQYTKLTPKKHSNALLAEMVALKFNIAASAIGKTPAGFGELVFARSGHQFDGMSVKAISARVDTAMTFFVNPVYVQAWYDSALLAVSMLNRAFTGRLDTLQWERGGKDSAQLYVAGAGVLQDVPYLTLPPGPFAPVTMLRTSDQTEPEDDFEDEEFGDGEGVPVAARLYQNYPNPFNPATTIAFNLREESRVTIRIFDLLGREVTTLFAGEEMEEGMQEVTFDASRISSGIYFYQIDAEGLGDEGLRTVVTNKMVLLK